jgi:hypothetical protein
MIAVEQSRAEQSGVHISSICGQILEIIVQLAAIGSNHLVSVISFV